MGCLCIGVVGLTAGCFSTGPAAGQPAGDASTARCISSDDADRLADQVLDLVNLERAQAGIPPVVMSPQLKSVAGDYACRMIDDAFFDHVDPYNGHGPGERAAAAKYTFYAIGENLAAGQETPAEVMKTWMDSPSHRAIILDPRWREVGIAVRNGGEYAIYWVQEFADPADY